MFDRCRVWRQRLTARTEGTLPLARWAELDVHLSECSRCRAAAEADAALRAVLCRHTGIRDVRAARAFDDRVLASLRAGRTPSATLRDRILAAMNDALRFTRLPRLGFLTQIMGGAVVAASVTAWCLAPTLRPTPMPALDNGAPEMTLPASARNEPPIPLESLLSSPAPRAALLWTLPPPPREPRALRTPDFAPGRAPQRETPPRKSRRDLTPRDHSAADDSPTLS